MTVESKHLLSSQDSQSQCVSMPSMSDSFPQPEAFFSKPQTRFMFVDRRYHLPFLSQAALAGEADEGMSVYLIPLWELLDDAWVGAHGGYDPQILGSCQSNSRECSLMCNQYHQAPRQPDPPQKKACLSSFSEEKRRFTSGNTN